MKTSEVFKALEKNPNLKFVCKNGNKEYFLYTKKVLSTFYGFQCRLNGEIIDSKAEAANFFGNIKIDADWQPVSQPVTWQEAITALINGKEVACECKECAGKGDKCEFHFSKEWHNSICTVGIKEGTWYIEEGDANG